MSVDKKIRTERVRFMGGGMDMGAGSPGPSGGPSGGPSNSPGSDPSPAPTPTTPSRETYRTTPTPSPTPAPTGPTTRHNPHNTPGTSPVSTPDTTTTTTTPTSPFNIHDVGSPNTLPLYDDFPTVPTAPSINYSLGPVAGVDYSVINNPLSQYNKNINLNNQLLNTPYKGLNTPFVGLNFLGNTLGKIGYNVNTKFFSDNSIGGKINPETGQPFGYGIDGYKDYMRQRSLGNVGAYGGTELSQNAINARSGGDDGIMDVYNDPNDPDDGDSDGDGDVDQDDFIFRYFDKTGETLQAGAGGVQDLMTRIRQRISDIFS